MADLRTFTILAKVWLFSIERIYWGANVHAPEQYLAGVKTLEDHGVDMVKVHVDQSRPGEFVVVNKIDVKFSLHDLLYSDLEVETKTRSFFMEELVRVSKSTAWFDSIADF